MTMLDSTLRRILLPCHQAAGLYLPEEENSLVLRARDSREVARWNATKVSVREIYEQADAEVNRASGRLSSLLSGMMPPSVAPLLTRASSTW